MAKFPLYKKVTYKSPLKKGKQVTVVIDNPPKYSTFNFETELDMERRMFL